MAPPPLPLQSPGRERMHLVSLDASSRWKTPHTVSWLNSSVTLLVSKAPLNRTVKNGCFWVDPPFRFRVQKANFAFLFSGGLKKKADPLINFPLLTKSVTWDTVWLGWEGGANKRIPERRFALGQYVITRKDITGTKCPTINTHEQRIFARHIVPGQNVCWDTLSQDKMSWNRPSLAGIVPKFWEHLLKLSIP